MKLGSSSWSFRKEFNDRSLDLLGFVDLAAELGLDGIEPLTSAFPSVSKRFQRELREKLASRNIELSAIAISNDFAQADDAERARECDDLIGWVSVARDLGVKNIRTFTGYSPEGAPLEEPRRRVVECYAKVLPAAERANVTLAIENHSSVFGAADELVDLVMRFGSDCLQLNPDPTNFLRRDVVPEAEREIVYTSLAKAARHAVHSHLKIRDFDAHGVPTNVDVPRLLAIYRRACYDGYLSFEYFGDADAAEAVRKGVQYLRPLIGS